MEIRTIVEDPVYVLESKDYNNHEEREIYADELRNAKVGDTFDVPRNGWCGRAVFDKSLRVIYKDKKGVTCELVTFTTTDSPNPVSSEEFKMIRFDLNRD